MKDVTKKLIALFKSGYCTPQIARIAKKLKLPSTTIHYNIKRLEKEGIIQTYKSVLDYKKIDEGHCTYLLVDLIPDKYGDPELVAKEIAKNPKVESIDIVTGEHELIIKLRCKDIDEYYHFVKFAIKHYGFAKLTTLTSLKQVKTEFVQL